MNNGLTCSICVALLATSSLAAAAEGDLAERVAACARERDDATRLACFDRLTAKPATTAQSATAPQPSTEAHPAPPVQPAAPAAPKAAASAAAAATAATAATAAPSRSSIDEFGVKGSEVARQRETEAQTQAGSAEKIDHLNAAVTAVSKKPRGELVVTLDNGQVWAQKEAQYVPLKVGDQVTILAGALHSYRLVVAGRATPVTRIQ